MIRRTDLELNRRELLTVTGSGVLGSVTVPTVVGANDGAEGPTVYVGSSNGLHAVGAETGEKQWEYSEYSQITSSPTVVDGTVYVGTVGDVRESDRGPLIAVDAVTGDEKWAFGIPLMSIHSSPTVVDGTVYGLGSGGVREELFAVGAESGEKEWKSVLVAGAVADLIQTSSPNVVDGTLYVGSSYQLSAVDSASGETEWEFDEFDGHGSVLSSPTAVDGTVYVGSHDQKVYALDMDTGEEEWTFDDPEGSVHSSPTVVDGSVFVGTDDSSVFAIDAASGTMEWHFETDDRVRSSPTVANDVVYVGSGDGFFITDTTLYALDAETGEELWSFETDGRVISSPTVFDGTVYVGSYDGGLYAVDAQSGDEEWRYDIDARIRSSPTVVGDPEDGDSDGTRVNQGTLGHHHHWGSGDDRRNDTDSFETISIDGESSDPLYYQLETSGEVVHSTANGGATNAEDVIMRQDTGTIVYGYVKGGTDSYEYNGEITSFNIQSGAVSVLIDGEQRNIDELIELPDETGTRPNTISIDGEANDPVYYQFETSEDAVHSTANGGTINAEDVIVKQDTGTIVYGYVKGGTDSYEYTGEITSFNIQSKAASVTVNGEERDLDEFVELPDETGTRPNTISIDGEASDPLYYQFETSGEVVHSTANGGTINAEDVIMRQDTGATVFGYVKGGTDSYEYNGEITSFNIQSGAVSVLIDGEQRNIDELIELSDETDTA